jgi:hypothetical protein
MSDKHDGSSSSSDRCAEWVIGPPRDNAARLCVSIDAAAHELDEAFVRRVTAIVREVQVVGGLTIGDDGAAEGKCGVLGSCGVNKDRCPVLQICGTNA